MDQYSTLRNSHLRLPTLSIYTGLFITDHCPKGYVHGKGLLNNAMGVCQGSDVGICTIASEDAFTRCDADPECCGVDTTGGDRDKLTLHSCVDGLSPAGDTGFSCLAEECDDDSVAGWLRASVLRTTLLSVGACVLICAIVYFIRRRRAKRSSEDRDWTASDLFGLLDEKADDKESELGGLCTVCARPCRSGVDVCNLCLLPAGDEHERNNLMHGFGGASIFLSTYKA